MTDIEAKIEVEAEELTEDLSDEALDRQDGKACVCCSCNCGGN